MQKIKHFAFAIFILLVGLLCLPVFTSCGVKSAKFPSYHISAEYNADSHEITATQKVTFVNDSNNTVQEVKFNLFPSAYRANAKYSPVATEYSYKAYYKGKNYGGITITSVKIKNADIDFSISGEDENILTVPLEKALYPDEQIDIEIAFTLSLAEIVHRLGVNDKTVNLGNWYPVLCKITDGGFYECEYYSFGDPFYAASADYTVDFTCKSSFKVASSGVCKKTVKSGDMTTYKFKANKIRDFALVLSEEFQILTAESNGVKVEYFYLSDESPQASLDLAVSALDYFSETFGKYPYEKYTVAQTFLLAGGMEYGNLSMVTYGSKEYDQIIIHETAHQWWYNAVGNNQLEEAWLDEGLAEYSVLLYLDSHSEYGINRKSYLAESEEIYKVFCSVYKALTGGVDTSMNRHLRDYNSEYEYVNLNYVKPIIMLDGARESIGDGKFFNALEKYYKNNLFGVASADDFYSAFESSGGRCSEYFESFVSGKAII